MEAPKKKSRDWWKLGDGFMLATYASTVLWTLQYHEKWADEAQAWLLARDLGLGTIWLREARYEGSPGLWHTILWVAQHVFHAGYGALGYIGAALAIAGAAVLLFLAPFPRYLRWPLAFTYVMVYQYAVIARPYTMLPLLAFCAAILFRDVQRPGRMTVVLILLAILTIHGTILAVCLGLAYLIEARKYWATFDKAVRKRYLICLAAMTCTLVFLFLILKPTPDVEEFILKKQFARAPPALQNHVPGLGEKLISVTSGAFLDWFVPSVVFILLLAAWCVWRRKWCTFILPVGMMIAFYGAVHGYAHHHGTVFLAAITGLWIAWPGKKEKLAFKSYDQLALMTVKGLLLLLCAINIWDSAVVIKREYLYPYSGAEDAARYLKAVGADRGPMFGLLFGVAAVQAYFDHNIFANNPTAHFHHGLPLYGTWLDVDLLERVKPEYVVAYSMEPELMVQTGVGELTSRGYELVHFSDGYYLYKRSVFEREAYFIFQRKVEAGIALPGALGMKPDSSGGEIRPH
jgi:hypothetical protein